MSTALKELLEDAAVTPPPPLDGLDLAMGRARRLKLRTRLVQAAAAPVAAVVLFTAISMVTENRSESRLRTLPPASHPTTTTTSPLPGGAALPKATTTTTVTLPSTYEVFQEVFFPEGQSPPPPPVFSGPPPPGFRIAFYRDNALWTMKDDGTDRRKLYEPGLKPLSWATDRRTLVLATYADGHTSASAFDVLTGGFRDLVKVPGGDVLMVDISPDGRRMVYAYSKEPENESEPWDHVVVADIDGRNAVELPNHGRFAVWSPDGTRLATRCPIRADGTSEGWVCTMRPDGTDAKIMPYLSEPFSWSPDGQWLAGTDTNGNRNGLRLVRVDGSGEERVVGLKTHMERPVWTLDSKHVVYTRQQVPPFPHGGGDVCLRPPCTWEEGVFSAPIDGGAERRISDSSWDWSLTAPIR